MISFDHTFKVAAGNGYLRSDGKWVHQYDNLMNENGKIVSWQRTCFGQIHHYFAQ